MCWAKLGDAKMDKMMLKMVDESLLYTKPYARCCEYNNGHHSQSEFHDGTQSCERETAC